jgi:hypothetical protein
MSEDISAAPPPVVETPITPAAETDTSGSDSLSTAYSETGPEKSSQIDAGSGTNITAAPQQSSQNTGSSFVSTTSGSPTTSRQDQKAWFEQGVKDRDAAVANNWGRTPTSATSQRNASPAQMNPVGLSPEASKQTKDEDSARRIEENKQMTKDKAMYSPKPAGGGGGGGGGGNGGRDNSGMVNKPMPGISMPVPGSGVKRAFYTAQADTLNAMLPYWKLSQ